MSTYPQFPFMGGSAVDSVNTTDPSNVILPPSVIVDNLSTTKNKDLKYDATPLAERVRNSEPFKNAYAVFSSDVKYGARFLNELNLIPYMVSDAEVTINDRTGASNKYDDKQDAGFLYCMERIALLLRDYYSFINTLQITQVQQYRDAGINSAITGQGVNPSQLADGVSPSSDPSKFSSDNPMEFGMQLASFTLDVVSGISSIVGAFQNISINRDLKDNTVRLGHESVRYSKKQREMLELGAIESFARFSSDLASLGIELKESTGWDDFHFGDLYNNEAFRTLEGANIGKFQQMMDTYYPYLHKRGWNTSDLPLNIYGRNVLGYDWTKDPQNEYLTSVMEYEYDNLLLARVWDSLNKVVKGEQDFNYETIDREIQREILKGSKRLQGLNIDLQNLLIEGATLDNERKQYSVNQAVLEQYMAELKSQYLDYLFESGSKGNSYSQMALTHFAAGSGNFNPLVGITGGMGTIGEQGGMFGNAETVPSPSGTPILPY